ncbi:hypothetical protein H4696_003429 [Amycolatopsis lexingtonensis]|uniref:Uncharacterized protein n=1 Tax=Amycolatopsis lexingtonensis TaxID=218822 RepID=A0ABR9HZJ2_9PSEU|nr:hypothetical protein [Amycolatopsis lexingtonensis]
MKPTDADADDAPARQRSHDLLAAAADVLMTALLSWTPW